MVAGENRTGNGAKNPEEDEVPHPRFCVSADSKRVKVVCFDTVLQVFITKGLGGFWGRSRKCLFAARQGESVEPSTANGSTLSLLCQYIY